MFTSSRRSRGGGVRWVEPGRRRRRRLPLLPVVILVLLLAAAGAVAYVLRERANDRAELRNTAVRFAAAWAKGRPAAMFAELDADARSKYTAKRFADDYRTANATATVEKVVVGRASETVDGKVTVPVAVRTKLFGTLRGRVALPVTRNGERVGVRWRPYLRLPGLRPGERVRRTIRARPRRAAVLGADGRRLDREPAAQSIAGRAPAAGDPGFGLEARYNGRLAGRPSAELRFGSRRIAATKARRGHSVRSTIRPGLQRAAVAALGQRLGGVAVMRPRDGSVLALSGLAVSAPQPPGSTFKIITAAAALQAKVATLGSTYPVRTSATLSGVRLRNASDESCGGSLTNAFTVSCNSVFAPLGAKLGARRMVAAAERFGFNTTPRVPAAKRSVFPKDLKDSLAVGAASIGQERDLATPLQMAAVGATIANGGVHPTPRIVRSDKVIRHRAVSRRVAGQVRGMMISVVHSGTGTAAALPGVEVAGKTGTAELRPTADATPDPKNTDAWFVAFAPAGAPKVVVAVMLVGAGAGGKAAAPIARQVLQAAL
ncbi:MAG: penicillin-binding protein [Solirubrobacteraceae bacterium]|jgi:beta-lactamase class D|nr:penicillin-binding protein [Solirubrobacteraceae bacterium]